MTAERPTQPPEPPPHIQRSDEAIADAALAEANDELSVVDGWSEMLAALVRYAGGDVLRMTDSPYYAPMIRLLLAAHYRHVGDFIREGSMDRAVNDLACAHRARRIHEAQQRARENDDG